MAVDTQKLTISKNPVNGLANNPRMQRCLMEAADNLGRFLAYRIQRLHSQQIPLTRSGAIDVINKLRRIQPRSKINKLLKIVDQIPWDSIKGSGMSVVPHSGTQVFIKNEGFPSGVKPPRLIAFPQEGEKLLMSMAFYHIMFPMFSSGYCTKEISEHDRPRTIEERLGGLPTRFVADYTSWECVPNKLIMQLGEHRVLKYCTHPDYWFLFDLIEAGGTLRAKSGFTIRTTAVQYSGRYTTSLCNTIRNKLMMDASALYMGLSLDSYRGVFEGDDSLTAWPAWVTQDMIEESLGRLGVSAEIVKVEDIGKAGYCSMYWNSNYELVCEPIKVIATFPFSSSQLSASPKNAKPLLAAKAMSLAYRAPGCPIVWSIARRYIQTVGLLETRNEYERRWFSQFSVRSQRKRQNGRQKRSESSMRVSFDRWDLIREPTPQQRRLFLELFGVTPADQILAEEHILNDEGFTTTLISLLSEAQPVVGVNLDELNQIYLRMCEKHF
uniref:RNA-dependent RNA polymerase n=1 Tax=Riboviria sp. TaxID=2585031 RepID=A0A8K1N5P1_9VIRU|nr:MAG: RNA-dependent RNA polymerase [Riboviria sp.]